MLCKMLGNARDRNILCEQCRHSVEYWCEPAEKLLSKKLTLPKEVSKPKQEQQSTASQRKERSLQAKLHVSGTRLSLNSVSLIQCKPMQARLH